jgi:D12 class N6 adenine-specific DNA methyltransferase
MSWHSPRPARAARRSPLTPSPLSGILPGMHPTPTTPHSYPGGKAGAGVYQRIINLMPCHTVYIEPFLGHGAVLLHKRPALHTIGLDLDARAVKVVRARLTAALARHGASRSVPLRCDDAADTSAVTSLLHRQRDHICSAHGAGEDAADTLRTHRQSDIPCSVHGSDEDAGADLTIGHVRYRLLVGDAVDFLRAYPFTGSELVYCDPPYVRSTRRTRARLYRNEMDDRQHTELLAVLSRVPCAVMVSGYHSTLYADLLHDWRTIEYQTMTRGGPATEVVWMNYPPPTNLHEYTHLGANFRERERQKRQQARWAKKVAAKPLLEQKALLAGLLTLVGPIVSAEVMRSALVHFGDEALIASNGTRGSHPRRADDTAATHAPARTAALPRPSRCTICRSPARARVDQALAAGASVREVAEQEGLSKSGVGRHRDHRRGGVVSHLQSPISGTPDTAYHQGQTPRRAQLELLSMESEG